jgi:uncharacterized protein
MIGPDLDALSRFCLDLALGGETDPAHDLGHLRRVLTMARRIAGAEGAHDARVLTAAALLHNLVNLPKDHPDRAQASTLSSQAAVKALAGMGFSDIQLQSVAHAIAAHSYSAAIPPQTPEARALQDSDRLDALGAIGIARMFAVSGRLGRTLYDPQDPMALDRDLDDKAYALDHLETKLFGLVSSMQTATGREIAEERADWMHSFRTRLLSETR